MSLPPKNYTSCGSSVDFYSHRRVAAVVSCLVFCCSIIEDLESTFYSPSHLVPPSLSDPPLSIGRRMCTSDWNLQTRVHSFGGTPKARQPLMFCLSLCLSLCLSRSHVHTSGTKPAVCLLGFLVITLTVNPQIYFPANSPKKLSVRKQRKGERPMTSPTEGGPGGHPPRHSHVPPAPPKARAKQFS